MLRRTVSVFLVIFLFSDAVQADSKNDTSNGGLSSFFNGQCVRPNDTYPDGDSCPNTTENAFCGQCRSLATALIGIYETDKTPDHKYFKGNASGICVTYNFYPKEACDGLVNHFFVIIEEIYLKLRLDNLNNTQIAYTYCGLTLQGYNCTYDRSSFEWSVPIHGDTPSCSAYNPFYCNTKTECNSTSHPDQYCIVHLTDIHIHRNYTVGSESDCDLPCCCDISQVNANSSKIKVPAKRYGAENGKCDVPEILFKSMLADASRSNCEYVVISGDYANHRYWMLTKQEIEDALAYVTTQIVNTFQGRQVIFLLGNHDTYPVNSWAPPGYNNSKVSATQSILDNVAGHWPKLITNDREKQKSIAETLRKQGYYKICDSRTKLCFIALNIAVCLSQNFWMLYDSQLVYDQLVWFEKQMNIAECEGYRVTVVMHVPSNEPTLEPTCANQIRRILLRYSSIINVVMSGHTHLYGIQLYYFLTGKICPSLLGINGGSLSSWASEPPVGFPNYATLEFEKSTKDFVRVNGYNFDLKRANNGGAARWDHLYTFPDDYGFCKADKAAVDCWVRHILPKNPNRYISNWVKNDADTYNACISNKIPGCVPDQLAKITQTVLCRNLIGVQIAAAASMGTKP